MANFLYGHQAVFTTTQANPIANFRSNLKVRGGVWSGMAAADTLTIVDLDCKSFTYVAPTGDDVTIGPLGWLRGITIPVIDGGTLNLYLDK